MRLLGQPHSNLIGFLITRENLDINRGKGSCTQRKDHVRTQREGSQVQTKVRGLSINTADKINACCLSHPACDTLLWQP